MSQTLWVILSPEREDSNIEPLQGVYTDLDQLVSDISKEYSEEYGYDSDELSYSDEKIVYGKPTSFLSVPGHPNCLMIVRIESNQFAA